MHVKPSVKKKYMLKASKFFGKTLMKKLEKKKTEAKALKDGSTGVDSSGAAVEPLPLPPLPGADSNGAAVEFLPPPPLPPPLVQELGPFKVGDKVRIWSDRYGKQWCGKQGEVKSFTGEMSMVVETDTLQKQTVHLDDVELLAGLKPATAAKNLRQLPGAVREQWLMETGFGNEVMLPEDSFATAVDCLKSKEDVWVTTEMLSFFWRFTHWGLEWPSGVAYVDPQLTHSWYKHDGEGDEGDDMLKTKWRTILKAFSGPVKVVLIPLTVGEHWTLLVLQMQQNVVKYYDSLKFESESGYLAADMLLTKLKQQDDLKGLGWLPEVCPHRCNCSLQGTMQCGYFVAWWMEEEVRELMGQGRWCRGWPNAALTRQSMQKAMGNCVAASIKMQKDLEKLKKAEEEEVNKLKAAGLLKDKFAAVAAIHERLGAVAKADLAAGSTGGAVEVSLHLSEEQSVESWAEDILNLLLPAHQEKVKVVRETMTGICSKCRWTSGCAECQWWKTVRYFRMKETKGKFMEAYGEAYVKTQKAKKKMPIAAGGGGPEVAEQSKQTIHFTINNVFK